jgi:hypothetical protein
VGARLVNWASQFLGYGGLKFPSPTLPTFVTDIDEDDEDDETDVLRITIEAKKP